MLAIAPPQARLDFDLQILLQIKLRTMKLKADNIPQGMRTAKGPLRVITALRSAGRLRLVYPYEPTTRTLPRLRIRAYSGRTIA